MNGTMTGAGTQTDPYICEDVFDFCNIGKYNGTSDIDLKYVKQVNDIDFNDHSIYKNGVVGNVALIVAPYVVYYGNSNSVRNLVFKDADFHQIYDYGSITFNKIYNTKFENVVLINCSCDNTSSRSWIEANGEIKNCSFGILAQSPRDFASTIPINCTDCTININGVFSNELSFSNKKIIRTHLNLNVECGGNENNSTEFFSGLNIENCYFTGRIKKTNGYGYTLFAYSTIKSSYFAMQFERGTDHQVNFQRTSVSVPSMSFVDKELGGFDTPNKTNMKFLTTEQCKSIEYLQSIGFLVVPAEVS